MAKKFPTRPALLILAILAFSAWAIAAGDWPLFARRVVDGLNNGFIYGVMALSLVLIYKATGVINFAQGNMAMFGTFIAYTLVQQRGLSVWLAVLVAVLVSSAGAALIERVTIRPFDPANHLGIIIVTLAWYLIFSGVAGVIWGFDARAFPTLFPSGGGADVDLAGIRFGLENLGVWLIVLATMAGVSALLLYTRVGLAFRAVSSSLESSLLHGIHIGRTIQFGWGLAAAVGTLAGCLIAPNTYLDPGFMNRVLIYSFAAQTVGGLDSLGGAIVGGLVLGLVETMVGGYVGFIGPEFALPCAFLVIVLILLVRPNGLFGSQRVERV